MTALTLVEAAKLAMNGGETKKAGIISLYAENSDLLNAMKFEGISGNALKFVQEGDLPAVAFRGVNEGYTASNGTFNPQTVALAIAGGDLDVDNFIIKTEGADARSRHEALKVKALSASVTTNLIKGAVATDPRQFDGLQSMITGAQLIDDGATSGGDALSLTKLDQLIDSVDGPTHLLMSRNLRRKFMASYRSSTFPNILMSKNETGAMVLSYGDLPILVGYPQNKNTPLLAYEEANPGGGSAVGTSIYALNLSESGVVGISNGGIDVRDIGELDTAPVWRTRIEWFVSMVSYSPFAAARLRGIKDAAIVA
jgi:hypothetical protein